MLAEGGCGVSSTGGLLVQIGAVLLFFWGRRPRGHTICPAGLWGEGLFVEAAFKGAWSVLVAVVSCMPYCHRP